MEAYLESLGTPGPALFAVAGLLALAYFVGLSCLRGCGELEPDERGWLALLLGLDLLALVAFPLAWLGWLARVPFRSVFALALIAAALRLGRRLVRAPWRLQWRLPWPALPILACGAVFVVVALACPFSWDDLVYQVAVPLRWQRQGGLAVFADNPYSGFPSAFAVLNLVLVQSGGILAPAVFSASLWIALALLLRARVAAMLGPWASTAAALGFALSWPVVMESFSAYAEIFLALQLLAVVLLASRVRGDAGAPSSARLVWLGVVSGVAAAIKLTGVVVPFLALVLLSAEAWRAERSWVRPRARSVLAFLGPLVAVLALFYARPFLATGNPLHPYFAGLFGGDEAALLSSRYHHDAGTARFGVPLVPSLATLGHFLATPVRLSLGPWGDLERFDGLIGLQALVAFALLAGLAFVQWRGRARDARPWLFLACAGLLYTFWFVTSQQTRFLIPACMMLTLAAAHGWGLAPAPVRGLLLALVPALALVSIPARTYEHLRAGLCVATGSMTRVDYIDSANPDHYIYACQAILERTPKDARLLLLYEQRGLYIPRDYEIGTPFFQGHLFTPPERAATAAEWLAAVRAEGITHVLVGYNVNDPDRMDSYLERTRAFQELLVSLRARELEVVWELRENASGDVRHGLYRVRDPK